MKNKIKKRLLFLWIIMQFHSIALLKAGEDNYVDEDYVEIYSNKSTLYITLDQQRYAISPNYGKVNSNNDLSHLQRFSEISKRDYFYQNLGVNGSASKHIYESLLVKKLGICSGYTVYDIFIPNDSEINFFNTKSPYVEADITLARYGSFYSSVIFSRNINDLWNFGISTRFMTSQKEFLENSQLEKSDRAVISTNFSVFSSFKTSDKKYLGLFRFFFSKHRTRESGGMYITPGYKGLSTNNTLFLDEENDRLNDISITNRINTLNSKAVFSLPETVEKILEWSFYQQFNITSKISIYLDSKISIKENYFEYRNREEDHDEKKSELEKKFSTLGMLGVKKNLKENLIRLGINNYEQNEYTHFMDRISLTGEIGTKFQFSKFFMMPYYKIVYSDITRGVGDELKDSLETAYLEKNLYEHFFAIHMNSPLKIWKKDLISANFEYQIGGNYLCKINYNSKKLNISLSSLKTKASLLQEEFHWFGRNWKNNFEEIYQHEGKISYDFRSKYFSITPFVNFFWIKNPIYFEQRELTDDEKKEEINILSERRGINLSKENAEKKTEIMALNPTPIAHPRQILDNLYFGYMGAKLKIKIWKIVLNSFFSFGKEFSSLKIIQAPSLITNQSIFYESESKDEKSAFMIGLDLHYKTDYMGDSYDPVIQKFFLQKKFLLFSYPIFDIFVNFRIERFKIFVKWSHINEFISKSKGYFSSPFYPGNKMALDIGVKWSFFD